MGSFCTCFFSDSEIKFEQHDISSMALNALLKSFDICMEYCDHPSFTITIYQACCVPVSLQVEDLKWEVEQRQREIETQKQQLEMVEQCHQREMDTLQDTLQVGYASPLLLSEHALWFFSSEFWAFLFDMICRG